MYARLSRYLINGISQSQRTIRKELVDVETEFAKVLLAEAIAIPADRFDDLGRASLSDTHVEGGVPAGIHSLRRSLCRELLIVITERKKLTR